VKKVLTAAVAALTIATTMAASTSNADAKHFKWGGWHGKYLGYSIAAGILGAAAYGAYACDRVVPVFNRFGEFVGYRRTCDWY
jgi:hypothetical protein